MSLESQVRQFNAVYNRKCAPKPKLPTSGQAALCVSLIEEELWELAEGLRKQDVLEIADALTDIIYVTAQQATVWGMPVDALLREVQRSNMSKLGADGKPVIREDGKVIKGPNFSEPDIAKVLRENINENINEEVYA
jgi:predicted HAD superfamily Cof-like phosphohydrolase